MIQSPLLLLVLMLSLAACLPAASPTAPVSPPTPTVLPDTPTPVPTATPTPVPSETVGYFQLRFEFGTGSDWTSLEPANPAAVLSLRQVGGTDKARIDLGAYRVSMTQPIDSAKAGVNITTTFDLALAPNALDQPFKLLLQKGWLNASRLRIYHVAGGNAQFIQEITHRATVSIGTNAAEFTLDLSKLKSTPARQGSVPRNSAPKMLWAFYYPWYNTSDWSSPQLKDHPVARYASSDARALARHIDQAKSAGIDGFVSSWWGPNHETDQNLRLLLDAARDRDFKVAIYLETLENGKPQSPDEMARWLAYAISTYRDHSAYMKVNGKPVMAIWSSNTFPPATWASVFERLRAQGQEAFYLGMGYDAASLSLFDGLHQYAVFNLPKLAQTFQVVGRSMRYYPLLDAAAAPKLWAATVQPGYDERAIPGRKGLFQERGSGAFYRSTFEAATASNPDWILITSWNEWWEHTYVEPSELYGDAYLQLTREYANKWKGK